MTRADIQAVMDRYPELTHFGMGVHMRDLASATDIGERYARERKRLLDAEEECNNALLFLTHTTKRSIRSAAPH